MSRRSVSELSTNRMVLKEGSGRETVFNFVTPTNWQVGDVILMQINKSLHDLDFVNGQIVLVRPPEPPNEWKQEFYTLYNQRTKDRVTVDFEQVEGFEKLLPK